MPLSSELIFLIKQIIIEALRNDGCTLTNDKYSLSMLMCGARKVYPQVRL